MNVVAVVLATDREVTSGAGLPEALFAVCRESLLVRTVRGVLDADCVHHVVVAVAPESLATAQRDLRSLGLPVDVLSCEGNRVDAIRQGFLQATRVLPGPAALLVHDGSRAFTPVSLIKDVVREVERGAPAVAPVLAVTDTIKQVGGGDISATVDRSQLRVVQTPLGFAVDVLRAAFETMPESVTDELGLLDQIGKPVSTVPGHAHALRVRSAFDGAVARTILAAESTGDHA